MIVQNCFVHITTGEGGEGYNTVLRYPFKCIWWGNLSNMLNLIDKLYFNSKFLTRQPSGLMSIWMFLPECHPSPPFPTPTSHTLSTQPHTSQTPLQPRPIPNIPAYPLWPHHLPTLSPCNHSLYIPSQPPPYTTSPFPFPPFTPTLSLPHPIPYMVKNCRSLWEHEGQLVNPSDGQISQHGQWYSGCYNIAPFGIKILRI